MNIEESIKYARNKAQDLYITAFLNPTHCDEITAQAAKYENIAETLELQRKELNYDLSR